MLLKKKAIKGYAEEMREKYDIRCVSVEQEARNLSGGNQQKVILARELEGNPDLLVAVHPTRGLDIGATRFVHDSMIAARDRGCGVLLISADFDEILEVSDRIVVMFEGQVMGEYPGKNPPIQEISLAMAGQCHSIYASPDSDAVTTYTDADGNIIDEEAYSMAADKTFSGLTAMEATIGWTDYVVSTQLATLTESELMGILETSWESFSLL